MAGVLAAATGSGGSKLDERGELLGGAASNGSRAEDGVPTEVRVLRRCDVGTCSPAPSSVANGDLCTPRTPDDTGATDAIELGAIELGAIELGAIELGAIELGAIELGAIEPCSGVTARGAGVTARGPSVTE